MGIKYEIGDCLELMKDILDGAIDMILCDLPYGTTKNKWDTIIPFEPLWEQYNRIIKHNGAIVLTAQTPFDKVLGASNLKMLKYEFVWDKCLTSGHLNANRMPLRQHENILVFYKKPPTYNPIKTVGVKSHSRGDCTKSNANNNYGAFNKVDNGEIHGSMKFPTTILKFQKPHPSVAVHPTQKPVELFEYLIKTYTNEGDTVLDNCVGSGTTLVACQNTNRNGIGFEKEPKYEAIIRKRIMSPISNLQHWN